MAHCLRLAAPVCVLGGLVVLAGLIGAAEPLSDAPAFSDRPQPLVEQAPRSEADADRVAAAALGMQARLLAHREDSAAALRGYQRAWRLDPGQPALLREIVALAFELKRNAEAARYAVIAAEHAPQDAVLLRRLATYLTERRDWKRALALYEKSLSLAGPRHADRPLDLSEATIYFELGRLYFLSDEFVRSAESFAKVRDALADPHSALSAESKEVLLGKQERTYSLWAESFLAARRWDEAESLFRQADEAHGAEAQPAELAFNLARVEAGRGNAPAALARLDEYFASKSSAAGSEPYELLADLISRGAAQPAEAHKLTIEKLERLHQADSSNPPLAAALAEQYFRADRLDDAQRLYSAAIVERPTGVAYRRLVEIYRRQDNPLRLMAVVGQLAAKSGSLDGLAEAGQALADDAPLVARLIEQTRQRQKEQPQSLADGEVLAAALLARQAKQYESADELFAASLAATKTGQGDALVRWGLAMLLADQNERAVKAFRQVLDQRLLPGGEASVQSYLAGALEMFGQTDEALAAARRAAELSPANASFALREGWVLIHAKRYDEARQAYQKVIEKFGESYDDASARDAVRQARMALSNIDLTRGDFAAATEWLELVLDEFPEDAGASNDLGYLWADRGLHLHRSLALIQRAVADQPGNLAYRDSLGWVLYRLGKYAQAEKELASSVAGEEAAGDDADGVILGHWGDALSKLGRTADALAAWQRAAAAFQKSGQTEDLEAVRKKLRGKGGE